MFDFLKKKIGEWIGKKDKPSEKKKKSKKEKKSSKKKLVKKEKIFQKDSAKLIKSKKTLQEETNAEKEYIELEEKEIEDEKEKFEKKIVEKKEESAKEEEKKTGFFSRLINRISSSELTQEQFDEIFMELELTLLENNVALEAVDKIRENLSKDLIGKKIQKKEAGSFILNSLKSAILSLLTEPQNLIEQIKSKNEPFTIIFFGINGTGKTTSIAKLANLLKNNGLSVVLSASDTFRAASIEQLQIHADNLKIPLIKSTYGSDPASVAFDAISYAKKNRIKVVLIDTAGRMYTKENLLKEMEKIIRVSKPDLKIFIGESITGNDLIEQAKKFNETIGIDGLIITKADIDEKAGAILSFSHVTGKPIFFLGTGQNYSDLEPFTKKTVLKNLGLD